MPNLLVKNHSGEQCFPIEGVVTIGRHSSNSVFIQESTISKHHAQIQKVGDAYIYKDLDSSNGSFLNELRIKKQTLKDGDTIRIGKVFLVFQDQTEIDDDISSLVDFEQFNENEDAAYEERVTINELGHFAPESEISDLNMLRVDYEKLRLGQALLQHIGMERDLKALLSKASKQLLYMFRADRCVILLLNVAGHFEAKAVQSVKVLDAPVSVSKSVLKEVQTSKTAVLLSDFTKDGDTAQVSSLMMMGVQSVMCAPIIHENKVIGAVHIDMRVGQGSFVKKDLQLLSGIVNYLAMAVANVGLTKKIERELKMQAQFEHLLSPNIVKQLVSGRLKIGKVGELRQVTVMFADIRGFTRMSHKTSPTEVVDLLNQYFERVVEIVFKHGGTIDKFMGDAVMVLFGAPIPMDGQEDAALTCALEIQEMLKIWNQERIDAQEDVILVGIGINSGEVVVGSIGSSQTMQYTCVGNAVNVASRLTGLAKAGQTVVGKSIMDAVKSETICKALPPAVIKGIDNKVQAYVVTGIGFDV